MELALKPEDGDGSRDGARGNVSEKSKQFSFSSAKQSHPFEKSTHTLWSVTLNRHKLTKHCRQIVYCTGLRHSKESG